VATFSDANASPTIGDFTATVAWGDGTTDTLTSAGGGIKASGSNFAILDSHTYNAPLTGATFSVTITDVGGSSTSTSATINVKQSAGLTINSLTPGSYTEGVEGPMMAVANFSDSNAKATTFTATVTFGDGTSVNKTLANGGIVKNPDGSYSVLLDHRYGEEGNYTFSVKVSDNVGNTTSSAASITVADAPLTIKTFTLPSPKEHVSFTSTVVTFTDANSRPDSKDYTATINWGDGTSSSETLANGGIKVGTGNVFSVVGTHTYSTFGNFTFSVQVVDKGGASTSTSAVINVLQGAIHLGTVQLGSQSIVVGGYSGGSVVDARPAASHERIPNTAPKLRMSAERMPTATTSTATAPVLTQQQVTDLVFQMGLTGSPVGTSVHLTGTPVITASTQAGGLQGQNQVLVTINQAMASSQNNALIASALRSAASKTQPSDSDDSGE
jgi:hypothetical protein